MFSEQSSSQRALSAETLSAEAVFVDHVESTSGGEVCPAVSGHTAVRPSINRQIAEPICESTQLVAASHSNIETSRVAVVILNYRTPEMVIDCLESLTTEVDLDADRVIVVDNQSPDDSASRIRDVVEQRGWQNWCRVVVSPSNDGFSAGNNFGIASQSSEFYWLLNSDTIVRPGALQLMLEAARANSDAAIVAPTLTWPDGKAQQSRFRFGSPAAEFLASAQLLALSRLVEGRAPKEFSQDASWVSFASVLVRATAYQQIGPMDDRYFMYYEDTDYCRRAIEHGWKIVSEPRASVVHLRGGSSPVKRLAAELRRRPFYYYASRARYFAKFYGQGGLIVANLCWSLGRLLSMPRDWLGIRQRTACHAEWRDNWTNILNPLGGASK
tara:strand:+ start:128174 stop:129328 length:1155 start_codon:yes stop_codon:yes gene_type:complete